MPRSWNHLSSWRAKYENSQMVKINNADTVKNVINRAIVFLRSVFSIKEYEFLKMISSNNYLPVVFDIYYGNDLLLNLIKKYYDIGYRIFISTHSSPVLYTIFDWLKEHPDVLVFNTTSTLSTNNFAALLGVHIMPFNLIRTAIPDDIMILRLFKDIFLKLPSILQTSEQSDLYEPLQEIPTNTFPFNNIVYIHIPSAYTLGYLQTLAETINLLNLNVELNIYEIIVTEENGLKKYELPNEAKYYLLYNNIASDNYTSSNDKPLIILNCDSDVRNSLIKLLDKPEYYDNYTTFGDTFGTVFSIPYIFKAALLPIGGFSRRGFVLSSLVDDTESINPFILSIFEIFSNCGTYFNGFLNNNFKASDFISQLINVKIMKTNSWSDKNLIVSKFTSLSDISADTTWKWEILFKNQSLGFEEVSSILPSEQTIVYPDKITDFNYVDYGEVNNFEKNKFLTNIACTGTNINTILDNKYLIVTSSSYLVTYKNFLIQNFTKELPLIIFNHHILFQNVIKFNIPIKNLEIINIDVIINRKDLLDTSKTISIHIPEIFYTVNEYFYDSLNGTYIDQLTRQFNNNKTFNIISDGNFDINISTIDEFELFLFKGHIVRIGSYESDSFNTNSTVTGYISQPININYLVIETDYKIGDKVIVKDCAYTVNGSCNYFNKGIVNSISVDKYTIEVLFLEYIDSDGNTGIKTHNVIKSFTQEEIYLEQSLI
jgi:hypothetical protein